MCSQYKIKGIGLEVLEKTNSDELTALNFITQPDRTVETGMSDLPFKNNSQFLICFVSEKKNQLTNRHQVRYSLRIQSKNSLQIASESSRWSPTLPLDSFTQYLPHHNIQHVPEGMPSA